MVTRLEIIVRSRLPVTCSTLWPDRNTPSVRPSDADPRQERQVATPLRGHGSIAKRPAISRSHGPLKLTRRSPGAVSARSWSSQLIAAVDGADGDRTRDLVNAMFLVAALRRIGDASMRSGHDHVKRLCGAR